jgi:DNA (cytosine-5)-methyltransferase 1
MVPSFQKLEWNCKGAERDLNKLMLQFRPSGLRARHFDASPALVSMTVTQIPFLGPKRRFLTRREGLRIQGFDTTDDRPNLGLNDKNEFNRFEAFKAIGNAVHVDVVESIGKKLLRPEASVPPESKTSGGGQQALPFHDSITAY